MQLEMFFNELSLEPVAPALIDGQLRAECMLLTVKEATKSGVGRVLHLPIDFFNKPLCQQYTWNQWRVDGRIDKDLRRFFISLATKTPFLTDSPFVRNYQDIDCVVDSKLALGIKAAYLADGLCISLQSDMKWGSHFLNCEIREIVDDDVMSFNAGVKHASKAAHVSANKEWIKNRIINSVRTGDELWLRKLELFPCLIFCESIKAQMALLPHAAIPPIVRGLFLLNDYSKNWTSGPFNMQQIGCEVSPESSQTLRKYAAEHTFTTPDATPRLYSLHAKPGKYRIYFNNELGPSQSLLIGSVGAHLPTIKHHN